jgi:hypothetical protein
MHAYLHRGFWNLILPKILFSFCSLVHTRRSKFKIQKIENNCLIFPKFVETFLKGTFHCMEVFSIQYPAHRIIRTQMLCRGGYKTSLGTKNFYGGIMNYSRYRRVFKAALTSSQDFICWPCFSSAQLVILVGNSISISLRRYPFDSFACTVLAFPLFRTRSVMLISE